MLDIEELERESHGCQSRLFESTRAAACSIRNVERASIVHRRYTALCSLGAVAANGPRPEKHPRNLIRFGPA